VDVQFGALLRRHRAEVGLTQEELAERSGISVRAIADLERGRTARPYRRSITLLADALKLVGAEREEFTRSARAPGGGPAGRPPHELPADVAAFTGRAAELAELDRLLGPRDNGDGGRDQAAVVIAAVSGTAGVGKTALTVRWAHQARARFSDGQLYADLRGYGPDPPVAASDALAGLLRSLGVAGPEIPAGVDERAARYRSVLDGRQVLVILDNAASAEQVGPLLPGTPSCSVIVTSRDSLAGLVARHGARRISLDLLDAAEAAALLRTLIGGRADADAGAVDRLAGQCARLPLALRIAAELAAARPDVPLADLADELDDQQRRLDRLDAGGDPRTAVRAVFSWSCGRLDPDAARVFRRAGLHPGPDLDAYATAALTGSTADHAARLLDGLARAHLIGPARAGRHGLHDLLRAYARERAQTDDGAHDRRAALTRLLDYYLHTAALAMDALFPAERHRRPTVMAPPTPVPAVTDGAAAGEWLDAHRASLVAAAGLAADEGWPGHAVALAATVFRYLEHAGHYPEIVVIGAHARRAAQRAGDRDAEAEALLNVAVVDLRQGRYAAAAADLEQALALFRATGNQTGQARSLGNLGIATFKQGRYDQAAACHRQALAWYQESGDRVGEPRALNNLALIDLHQGRYQQAADRLSEALAVYQQAGDTTGETRSRASLGIAWLHQGRLEQAEAQLRLALDRCAQVGDPVGQVYALTNLALTALARDRPEEAAGHLGRSLAINRDLGDLSAEAEARNALGQVRLAQGDPVAARAEHATALRLATQIRDAFEQARAHAGLAAAARQAGEGTAANRHARQAGLLFAGLGAADPGASPGG
jgi:tetratricopeptide (TPR) repeat protein/transcriptional regulator with XRE-family HTH domain